MDRRDSGPPRQGSAPDVLKSALACIAGLWIALAGVWVFPSSSRVLDVTLGVAVIVNALGLVGLARALLRRLQGR